MTAVVTLLIMNTGNGLVVRNKKMRYTHGQGNDFLGI